MKDNLENELVSYLDELTEKRSSVIRYVTGMKHLINVQSTLLNILVNNGQKVIYVSLGMPWFISRWYLTHTPDKVVLNESTFDKIGVIDAITPRKGEYRNMIGIRHSNVTMLDVPMSLSQLLKLLHLKINSKDNDTLDYVYTLEDNSGAGDFKGKFIVIDDISRLYLRYNVEQISKFLSFFRKIITKSVNTYGVVFQPYIGNKKTELDMVDHLFDKNFKSKNS